MNNILRLVSLSVVLILIVMVLGLAGCSKSNEDKSASAPVNQSNDAKATDNKPNDTKAQGGGEKITIKVAGYYGPGGLTAYDPFIVAQKLGYFKNINIIDSDVPIGPPAVAALTSGAIDASHLQYTVAIKANSKGSNIKIVAAAHGGQNTSNLHLYVPKNSPIKSAKDLKGKKIGGINISDTAYFALGEKLKSVGLSLKDVQLVTIPQGQTQQILASGQVDVAGTWSDFEQKPIEASGKYRVLYTVYELLPKDLIHCGLAVTDKLIREKPEVVKELVEGFSKANTWLQENPEKGKQLHLEILRERGIDPKNIALIEKFYSPVDIRQFSLAKDSDAQYFIDRIEANGDIPKGKIKASDLITNQFNPNVK